MSQIEQALTRLFDKYRILFWYDEKQELQAEYEGLALPGVTKIVLANNQFAVKHRLLRQEPKGKFLLYHAGPPPPDLENWLLDVQLANVVFTADQAALWLSELGLGVVEFGDLAREHNEFFRSTRRREALHALLRADDTRRDVQLKMLAVCAGTEARPDAILEHLLAELAQDDDARMRLINRAALEPFLWEQFARGYDYHSVTPSILDFAITLYKSCYALELSEPADLNNDALVFLKRWKDSVTHQQSFALLSARFATVLNIEQDLQRRDYHTLIGLDLFELVEQKLLSELVHGVAGRTLSAGDCEALIRRRRSSYWYSRYEHIYEAIGRAAAFFQALEQVDFSMQSLVDGIEQYSRVWYQLDLHYRKFIYHMRQSGQTTLLEPLYEQVENLYTNQYLLPVNDRWQSLVDAATFWNAQPILSQSDFFEQKVEPFLRRDNKVFVIISDALRYEIAAELLQRIRQEDRYDAELAPALTLLPSYTQLGMAALLPHTTLLIDDDLVVYADGQNTQGTEYRKKILQEQLRGRATAIQAEALLNMNKEESRVLFREHDVVYVYHNRIDATGDKRDTEERTFDAVEQTLDELVLIMKKLAGANVSNMLITADHGFIYQHRPLDESDFLGEDAVGAQVTLRNRRFVFGHGLRESAGFKKVSPGSAGFHGSMDILIPKSINRLRVRGAGSRYVHGGAALQEVVIPVLQINKKRHSDITQVEVDILRGTTSVITTGQLNVTFYQRDAVTAKLQPRTLRAGLYTQDKVLISDQHELHFDIASENARERELRVRFILTSRADEANEQEVWLRLEEPVPGTSHHQSYKSERYLLRRSFTSDFDF